MADLKATVDFPVTIYDRPGIAAANLAKGNIGGSIQALADPMGLSPEEMQNIRTAFIKGAGDNPVTKTLVDVATNPLVLLGLAMQFIPGAGQVGNMAALSQFFKKGNRYVKDVNIFMRPLVSMMTGFRSLNPLGFMEKVGEYHKTVSRFSTQYTKALSGAVEEYQKATGKALTKRDSYLIALKLEEWDKVPTVTKRIVEGKERFDVVGNPVHAYYLKHFGTKEALAPNLVKEMEKVSPHLVKLADQIKKVTDEIGARLFKDAPDEVLKEMSRKGIGSFIERGYFPHLISRTPLESWVSDITKGTLKEYERLLSRGVEFGVSKHLKRRLGGTLPYTNELEQVADALRPNLIKDMDSIGQKNVRRFADWMLDLVTDRTARDGGTIRARIENAIEQLDPDILLRLDESGGRKSFMDKLQREMMALIASKDPKLVHESIQSLASALGAPNRYTIDGMQVMGHYVNAVAPTYGWITKQFGRTLDDIVAKGTQAVETKAGAPLDDPSHLFRAWHDQVAPMLRGLKDPKEYARGLYFQDMANKAKIALTNPANPIGKYLPKSIRDSLLKSFSGGRGGFSDKTIGGKIAGLFYSSALGLNAAPAMQNLLQNPITTMNFVGPTGLLSGVSEVAKRMPKFSEIAAREGVEAGLKRAFPEYWREFGQEGISSAMALGDNVLEGAGAGRHLQNVVGKILQWMQVPFATTEKFNRLAAFYSFRNKAVQEGLGRVEAQELARNMTMFTQFTGGVMGQPAALRGVWAPMRQFLHFPLRYMEMLYGSGRMGQDVTKRSVGVLGRTMAGSAAVYELAKNLGGVDLSGGLAFGAMPKPGFEQGAFFPFPFVPPAISVLGDVTKSVATGDYGQLANTAALLVPGGIAARRAYKNWSPKYADYQNQTSDGRVPLYNKDHMLIGSLSKMELFMRGLGIKTITQTSEEQMMAYLLRHREQIRDYRRQWLEKISQNDLEGADKVNQEYVKKYPDLGPMEVRKSDIKAMENRKQEARLQRTIRGLPMEARGMFQQVVDYTGLSDMAQTIDATDDLTPLAEQLRQVHPFEQEG